MQRQTQHLPLVVARHMKPGQRLESLGGLAGQQGPAERVAQINHQINLALPQVGNDGLKRRQVAMNVGHKGQPHAHLHRFVLFTGTIGGSDRDACRLDRHHAFF